jgi:hypothetical protein
MDIENLIAKLEQTLPVIFPGSKVNKLTGGAINWGTTQNKRSQRLIPNENEIFFRSGRRILVLRDPFLRWFATTLQQARQPTAVQPPRRSRRTALNVESDAGDPPAEFDILHPPDRARKLEPSTGHHRAAASQNAPAAG